MLSEKIKSFIVKTSFIILAQALVVTNFSNASFVSQYQKVYQYSKPFLKQKKFFSTVPQEKVNKKTVRILSIDGGGIRAIIPLYALKAIEDRTGKPIAQLFDVIAGTSSGGLVSLALNIPKSEFDSQNLVTAEIKTEQDQENKLQRKPRFNPTGNGIAAYSTSDVLKIYEENADLVFNGKIGYSTNNSIFKILFNKSNYHPRHSISKLEELLIQHFREIKLSQALSTVLTTAYEIQRGSSHLFNSQDAKDSAYNDFMMKDVALSTSAAPTYFSPIKIKDLRPDVNIPETYHFVDGGVVSNNPTLRAYTQARKLFPKANDFFIVSLGTGVTTGHYIEYEKVKDQGVIGWAPLITPMLMHATSDAVLQQIEEILHEFRRTPDQQQRWLLAPRYHRLDIPLTDELLPLDKIDKKHIEQLKIKGHALVRDKHRNELDQIIEELQKTRDYATGLSNHILVPRKDLYDDDQKI